MTRGGKVLFSFIALVLGTFLFTVFVHYQFVYSLNIRFIKPEEYPLIGNYMPFYFYWGSVIGMAILALVILWIILRPTERRRNIHISFFHSASCVKLFGICRTDERGRSSTTNYFSISRNYRNFTQKIFIKKSD